MTSKKELEVRFEDHDYDRDQNNNNNKRKWCIPLKEDAFVTFMEKGNVTVKKIFGEGSFFSPLLFGKFFDPSDAFPLWEFESDVLLSNNTNSNNPRTSRQTMVDWSQTETDYVIKAELPGKSGSIQVCIEDGKVLEISGQWKHHKDSRTTKDWRGSHWWEHGFVRRVELPENADWNNIEACVNNNDTLVPLLDIRIPKKLHQVCEASSS